jgi:23S rRNA (cytidine1920-2'-O)/16S rRNA (cytidine1409-2'-O)-methyltransferase
MSYSLPGMVPRTPLRPSAIGRTVRADQRVVELGLVDSRSKAQAMILAGRVFCGERRVEKSGMLLPADAALDLRAGPRFVSRGGDKLAGALAAFAWSVADLVCVDVGASTGGFTDCLLQHGARKVYAVDVGHGQLAQRLRADARVVERERTNARHLAPGAFEDPVDLVVVDASFISLTKLLPAVAGWLRSGRHLLALVKPQFEVGRAEATRGRGVVRDPHLRERAIQSVRAEMDRAGFDLLGAADSVLAGPKGNREHFLFAVRR